MLALERTIPLNSNLLEQEPLFGFGFNPWSIPDSNDTASHDNTRRENRTLTPEELKRLRRMKSNRESARKSRLRKRIHLEELRIQSERLQAENSDLRTQLGSVLNRTNLVRHENRRLQIEVMLLKKRLDEAQTLLSVIRQERRINMTQNFHAFGRQGQASALASLIA